MKKLLAIVLAAVLLLSLVACGGGAKFSKTITLKYDDDEQTHYEVKLGYPDAAKLSGADMDSNCTITNEDKDYEIYAVLIADTTYKDNKDYAKENYELFKEGKFGGFDGYSYKEGDYTYRVLVNLGATEYENVTLYLDFDIGSAKRDLSKTAEQIFQNGDVQSIINSFEFLGKNPEEKK